MHDDCAADVTRIWGWMVDGGGSTLHKRSVVISLSGWGGGGRQLGECCLGSTRVGESKSIRGVDA